jgi:hypothetical protein
MPPGLSGMGVGSNWPLCSGRPEPSVLHARADCGGRLLAAKLGVVVHYLPHQLLDLLLADEAILLARQFCDCLRDRVDDFICFLVVDFIPARCRSLRLARKSRAPRCPPACPAWGWETVEALGIAVPQTLLLSADEVIE